MDNHETQNMEEHQHTIIVNYAVHGLLDYVIKDQTTNKVLHDNRYVGSKG